MNTLIVAGGEINLALLKEIYEARKPQIIIAVDKGLEALHTLHIMPNHIVGDFDSIDKTILEYYQNNSGIVQHTYHPEKDNTDTDIALELAIRLSASHITMIGALGNRMDHSLANIHILVNALEAQIPCEIIDTHNRIYLVNKSHIIKKEEAYGKYISLIPLTSSVEGLTLTGFQYPLTQATLTFGKSLGVSNEIVGDTACIVLENGILIVIESKD